jgi:hypothetical protein
MNRRGDDDHVVEVPVHGVNEMDQRPVADQRRSLAPVAM